MKSLGILSLAVLAGIAAAVFGLLSGGGFWSAVLNYLVVGTLVTLGLSMQFLLRAWAAERRLVPRAALHSTAGQGGK